MERTEHPAASSRPGQQAPAPWYVRAYLLLAFAGRVLSVAGLVLVAHRLQGHHFQPMLLGLVHVVVLLWLLPAALGMLGARAHREAPEGRAHVVVGSVAFGLYLLGAPGLAGHMWTGAFEWGFLSAALPLAAGLVLHAAHYAWLLSARRAALSSAFLVAALAHLALAAVAGLLLSWHLALPYLALDHLQGLRVHAHTAVLGFFGLLHLGLSLGDVTIERSTRLSGLGWMVLSLTVGGLSTVNAAHLHLIPSGWTQVGAAMILLGLVSGGGLLLQTSREVQRISQARAPLAYLLAAAGLGLALLFAGHGATTERAILLYGALGLLGFAARFVDGRLDEALRSAGLERFTAADRFATATFVLGLTVLAAGVVLELPAIRTAGAIGLLAAQGARVLSIVRGSRRSRLPSPDAFPSPSAAECSPRGSTS